VGKELDRAAMPSGRPPVQIRIMSLHRSVAAAKSYGSNTAQNDGTRVVGAPNAAQAGTCVLSLRLYLAKNALASRLALADLPVICKQRFGDAWELEVVDVMDSPQRALADGVLITPTLLKLSPAPFSMIAGNPAQMIKFLELLDIRNPV
jgi:circadian clock protein KaiB